LLRRDQARQEPPDLERGAAEPVVLPASRTEQTLENGGVAREAAAGWSCSACTYLNSNADYLQCEMCGTQRPYVDPNEEAEPSRVSSMGETSTAASRRPASGSRQSPASVHSCHRDGQGNGQFKSLSAEQLAKCSAPGVVASAAEAFSNDRQSAASSSGASVSETLSHAQPAQLHVHAEDWFTVLPHLKAWIDSDCTLSAEPLVEYAAILIKSERLEELGHLSQFLRRESKRCPHLQPCLSDFLRSAESLFAERYPRSSFKPFVALRMTVSAHDSAQ